MTKFWLERKDNFSSGCTELHFSEEWKMAPICFNNEEMDELRRVLGIGMGDCDHCDAWKDWKKPIPDGVRCEMRSRAIISHDIKRIEENLLHLVTRVTNLESNVNTAPLYDLSKRVRALENRGIVQDKALRERVALVELQLENHKKIDHTGEHTYIFKKLDIYDEKLQSLERVRDTDGKWIAEQGSRMNGLEERIKGTEDALIGHADVHMKNNLVEKVGNLERKTVQLKEDIKFLNGHALGVDEKCETLKQGLEIQALAISAVNQRTH
jgi:hypothetical protein